MPNNRKLLSIHQTISFAKEWRDGQLCFAFHGATKQVIGNLFDRLTQFCGDCQITTDSLLHNITNGKCQRSVFVRTKADTDILSEKELANMIIHMLQKETHYTVTYFDNFEKFLNA